MKKTRRRLQLETDTLRSLRDSKLAEVAGAWPYYTQSRDASGCTVTSYSCFVSCTPCV